MKKLKVAFIASEAHPFVKTGGLADVAYALPKALAGAGHEVVLFLPRYYAVNKEKFNCVPVGGPLGVPLGDTEKWAALYESAAIDGVRTVFIEHDAYFGRAGIYDDGRNSFADNAERFTFFSRACLQACMALDFDPDIVHCNDWQSALVPIYLKTIYKLFPFFKKTKSVFTIHNIGYQGVFDKNDLFMTQLGWEAYNENCLKFYDAVNFMKGAILWSDAVTTVSRRYAQEIQTPEYGYDLAGILKKRSHQLFGITNGVDYGSWNPETDAALPVKYTPSKMSGKTLCKEHLQYEFGVKVNPDIPLMATISRLTHQKGIDLLVQSLRGLAQRTDFQFIILGTGDQDIIDAFELLKAAYP
ncbi:MAG: glycogen synthase, partial [Spirochaetota bacterium]